METTSIETSRLLLRKFTVPVYQYLFQNSSDTAAMEQLGLHNQEELQAEKRKVEGGLTGFNRSFLVFQLYLKAEQRVIGRCGFHTWYLEHRRAEIGYALTDLSLQSKGLMTEALLPIIKFGFEDMGLNRIEAFVGPENTPSLLLLQKLGFTREGLLREHYMKNGQLEDSVVFSLLRKEYKSPI
ncbi:ribosomal-protein-alanine N-acetyltransferase [Chitinophaga polysaccharea]|uniref:Ribosomal-protein-alanine N-acetyltransferase n=1 Tax=Chitinophaga polysaccharea TaxID=1293035 RepID=A0A561PRG2_9BACT|nr:GNAT family protein [Chitinophaga polysaccharea]TWF40712.1 ribosomal-protein-alanine N-acetyltransferase [Chitinophaga polysaccharea]